MNRGKIKFDTVLLEQMIEDVNSAKALFSNFYPYGIVDVTYSNPHVMYFGYSEHFDTVKEGQLSPEYEMIFVKNEDGITEFKEMKRI